LAGNKTLKYHERKLLEKIEKICSENIHAQNFGVIQLAEKIKHPPSKKVVLTYP